MGHTTPTPAGNWRANWRDASGKQKAKTFQTKREAKAFLAEIESTLTRGTYVDPHAGRMRLGTFAARWQQARSDELATRARVASVLRTHVLPRWGDTPIGKVDHLAVQQWVTDLAGRGLSPASVADCHHVLSSILRAAVRDRLIGTNPCDGVKVPRRRKKDTDGRTITMGQLTNDLLPALPDRFQALVALAGGTGMRWGECVGLRWESVDLINRTVSVVRVAVEIAGTVTTKPYPKSRAGRRTVPLPPFTADLLAAHRETFPAGPAGEVFTNTAGGPMRRTLFRARVWRPALARAGLLGRIDRLGHFKFRAAWMDSDGIWWDKEFTTERDAIGHIARVAGNGLRFHDLRHSYATWLVSRGVPVNDVREVMGHEQASTTLNLYTHGSAGRTKRVLDAFADFLLTSEDPA
ncbi:site-specific recombinase XerD [Krasilnikovia cinnamomea]|uniref:Site-specific recombinase XerD n=1 Tax=Krasilnikovia cinnamomea TaxID=349313 RepID=A0A4Q7ZFT1_9ACTN|nr:site-specific integrase [Krasilnikovia cinnamomea]RZU49204.1 site-specific recombinase XerD [Krasilnikovia cinnamomea]